MKNFFKHSKESKFSLRKFKTLKNFLAENELKTLIAEISENNEEKKKLMVAWKFQTIFKMLLVMFGG